MHQGIVWGVDTNETKLNSKLVNRFDYDGLYGTVLNRFIVQAANSHPLTVYGTGGQSRAFIHINDTAECIRIALENAPQNAAKVRIMNQVSEVQRVRDLALLISEKFGVEINNVDNPERIK